MLEIRIARVEDTSTIAYLGRKTFNEAFGHLFRDQNDLIEYLDKTFSVSKIEGSLLKDENVFWIAFWSDLPVGYSKLKLDSSSNYIDSTNSCQLQKIYILKDFLSKKIGLILQQTLLKEAQHRGFEIIWLSVWIGNKRAISFYKKNNFRKVGSHNFEIGKENFKFQVMALDLIKGS